MNRDRNFLHHHGVNQGPSSVGVRIKDFLAAADVAIDVGIPDKAGLLEDLAGRAARALNLPAEALAESLAARDELGSTGIGGGVAIPHARLREVEKPFGALLRLRQAIEFDAIDGQPVDLVFLVLLPARSQLDQLNTLAAVARKLRDGEVLRRMRAAASALELYRIITD